MIEAVKDKLKALAAWVYNWITVLTGTLVGAIAVLPDVLMNLSGIDLSPLVGHARAAQIVCGVAVMKGAIEACRNRKASK